MQNNKLDIKFIQSKAYDPWNNLALEEYLLNRIKPNEIILYLWQNKDTVVIGRNQNSWKECRCTKLENDGGKLARRLSGGGAVYHDLGNLNFTFIMDKKLYNLEKQLEVILKAVQNLGIKAEFSGRNDITVNNKKFSGNAFYFTDDSAYHHGTILIDTDTSKLASYLQVSKEKIQSKGIDSVKSRVVNLIELNNNITVENMITQLKKSFVDIYGPLKEEINIDTNTDEFNKLYDKYASWEWKYGQGPKFNIVMENRFTWGGIELGLVLKDGYITTAKIFSDAMNATLIQEIEGAFIGIPFQKESIIDSINKKGSNIEDNTIIKDMEKWLLEKWKSL